jgi:hypothetical protein
VRELDGLLQSRAVSWDGREAFSSAYCRNSLRREVSRTRFLIDGSVLANAPFAQAIDALRNRPARREVDRRFVYIDPKPGLPSFRVRGRGKTADGQLKPPGFFSTIFGATSDIPREQPIRDSLNAIEGRSQRIARMREITDHLEVEVEHMIEDDAWQDLVPDQADARTPAQMAADDAAEIGSGHGLQLSGLCPSADDGRARRSGRYGAAAVPRCPEASIAACCAMRCGARSAAAGSTR